MEIETAKADESRSYVLGWRQKGARHPRIFDGRKIFKHTEIIKLVDAGCTCNEMARLCRTKLSNIHYAIRKQGLRPRLRQAQIVRFTQDARLAWTLAIGRHPGMSQNRLSKLEPRAYQWLWRYDRTWLAVHRPRSYVRVQKARSDASPPRGRGAAAAKKIRLAAKAITARVPRSRCTKSAIRKELGLSEYSFERMATDRHVQKALMSVIETPEAFRHRVPV